MSDNRQLKLWQWAVLMLVLCNIGLLVTIWVKPGSRPPRPETPRDFVIRKLQFTGEQVAKYDLLIHQHQDSMRLLRRRCREGRSALFGLLGSGNRAAADSCAAAVGRYQQQIEMVTYDHFSKVREICIGDQKKQFDGIIGEVLIKMSGGRPQGAPPGEHGPPPPEDGPPPSEQQ